MNENPYAAPRAEVADQPLPKRVKPSAVARFVWTACVAFPVYFAFVMSLPMHRWGMGALGSLIFAAISGFIALCIPVKRKALFIVPSIFAGLIAAIIIGNSFTD